MSPTIEQPILVVRLNPNNAWNKLLTYGFKWHLYRKNSKGVTACGIVVSASEIEHSPFKDVKAKDLCASCFKGLTVSDGKRKTVEF